VHIVTAAAASAQNIVQCIAEAGYDVADIVLEPYASSLSVLNPDERDLGVCIIDIGGGTTDLAMFFDGSIRYTSVLGLGGHHVTSDVSQGMRTSIEQAEEIKKKYGVALESLIEEDELIKVAGVGGRSPREISRSVLAAIIQPRMEEIFALAAREMEKSDVNDSMGAGVVLTGGASMIQGAADLAERIMGIPVRIGTPIVDGGLIETVNNPIYATGVGLIYYGFKHGQDSNFRGKITFGNILNRLKDIFENLFG
jgi:cell division protein FtsA